MKVCFKGYALNTNLQMHCSSDNTALLFNTQDSLWSSTLINVTLIS